MSEQNKMIARRAFEEVQSQGNLALVDEPVVSDYLGHTPLGEIYGPEGAKRFFSTFRGAFPDLQVTVEDQIAEGDTVVTRWTARGIHEGEFQTIPPTGRQMTMTGITIFRIANGKLVEGWTNADTLGMLQQLGAAPAPRQTVR
jgi:steroid delta-isomerase-like uncharacterized protein